MGRRYMVECDICYSDSYDHVNWQGKRVCDTDEFKTYLQDPVRRRLIDESQRTSFESDLRALATTDMASTMLKNVLEASETEREPWEIGEALAECLLKDQYEVSWPSNTERDKRTPKASLPGADLIGFIKINGQILLTLGEVKTSRDSNNPPGVMTGRGGMIHQLDRIANELKIHNKLLNYLHSRCKNTKFWPLYQEAVTYYLESRGHAIVLFGMLMRDTDPNQLDLENRALNLSKCVDSPTKVELIAWYLPCPVNEWPELVMGDAA